MINLYGLDLNKFKKPNDNYVPPKWLTWLLLILFIILIVILYEVGG